MSKHWVWVLVLGLWACSKAQVSRETRDQIVDSGTNESTLDAGTPDAGPGAGPWPNVPVENYSRTYQIGPVQSVAVDDAYNIWLLQGEEIGVLRPGDSQPIWTSKVGQAAKGFGPLAINSTVICGGSAGRAYVGYSASELPALRSGVDDPEYKKGDMDVVKLNPDGTVSLEEHLTQTVRYHGKAQSQLGIRNSNAWIYDEDRTVMVCTKVMRGPNRGDIFIGTNHGITMIRGLVYNSHRHPVWYKDRIDEEGHPVKSLMIGYNQGLGIGQDGDVLIANWYKVGILPAPKELITWDDEIALPFKLDTFVPVNGIDEHDFWRGFTQAKSGEWYLSSEKFGLWTFATHEVGSAGKSVV